MGQAEDAEFLTVAEIAKLLKVSEITVTRRFENLAGVIDLNAEERRVYGRPYRLLRIPRAVLHRFLQERAA